MKRLLVLLAFLVVCLGFFNLQPLNVKAASSYYSGLATRFTASTQTTANYQAVKTKMLQYGLNAIRLGSGDEMWGSSYTWDNGAAVQWFLDNTNFAVIVDRFHTVGLTSLSQSQWNTIDADLASMAVRWAGYGDRVFLEPVNEYAGSDFKTQMQRIINTFRSGGHSNWLVFNWNGVAVGWSGCVLSDPLGRIYVGYHYYFNTGTGLSAFNSMTTGHSTTGLPMFGSEEGANYNEKGSFTSSNVAELTDYLRRCANAGYSNVVWMDHELDNMAAYEQLGLVMPSGTTQQLSIVVSVSSSSVHVGDSVVLSAVASGGSAPYTYAWFEGGQNVGSSNTLSVSHTSPGSFVYTCRVTDSTGASATSSSVTVTWSQVPPSQLVVSIQASATSLNVGDSATLSASVSGGTPAYTYAWRMNGQIVGSSFSLTQKLTAEGTYVFTCTVTDQTGSSVTSDSISVSASASSSVDYLVPIGFVGMGGVVVAYASFGRGHGKKRRRR